MNRFPVLFVVLVLLLSGLSHAQAPTGQTEQPRLIAVTMWAEWCNSCRILDPKVEAVKREFEGQAVFFTRFDMTDDFTKEQSAYYASLIGLETLYREHAGKTGYMLLVKSETKEVVARITRDKSNDEIKQTISSAR